MLQGQESVDLFLGRDVGKTGRHAVAQIRAGKKLYDKALPQEDVKTR